MISTIVLSILLISQGRNKITKAADSSSCALSKQTVQPVENCPRSAEEWRKAAAKKNCSAYAHHCDRPDQFVYHCVINPYINETLEVCAVKQNIVHGYCAEYSNIGTRIQRNGNASCQNCSKGGYASDEAFKYPECYDLVKKSADKIPPTANITPNSTDISNMGSSRKKETGDGNSDPVKTSPGVIIVSVLAVLVIVLVLVLGLLWRKRRKESKSRDNTDPEQNEMLSKE
uniref:Uncharacterized protein LOC111099761 n=1 Tax=Crassostrea virginica TaxID=6565 RepID=A0A8B8A614_CRAVI|nr:uncharacterized protein LOC111099761 [Crassostrea virginica]